MEILRKNWKVMPEIKKNCNRNEKYPNDLLVNWTVAEEIVSGLENMSVESWNFHKEAKNIKERKS